jgi:hypothetical protein
MLYTLLQRLRTATCLCNNFYPRALLQQAVQALACMCLIIGNNYSD